MKELELTNHDLVGVVEGGALTHKMVVKARKGRRLSRKVQERILAAFLQACRKKWPERIILYRFRDLFLYDGG